MDRKVKTALVLCPLLVVFFVLIALAVVQEKPIGEVSALAGNVQVLHKGEAMWISAKLGLAIYQYDTIKTDLKSKVRLTFEDGSLLNLGEDTEIVIREHVYTPQEKRRVSLFAMAKGKLRVFCQKFAGSGSRFQVETPTAVIGIRGTQFFCWVVSNQMTIVVGIEDEVGVRNVDRTVPGEVIVKPGYMTKVGVRVRPLQPTIVPDELRHQLEVDTEAPTIGPSSANPEAGRVLLYAPKEDGGEPETAQGVIRNEETKVPDTPPFPQDPGDNPEFITVY